MHVRWAVLALGLLLASSPPAAAARRSHARTANPDTAAAPVAASKTIGFNNACAKGDRLTIAAVGDLLFHKQLEQQALTPTGNYRDFWKPLASVLANADLTYANFEGAAADGVTSGLDLVKDPGKEWNNRVYSSPVLTLSYNYHPSVIDDLISSGFDVVSTANNHAMDRGIVGIDRTVLNMQRRGLAFSGTRPQQADSQPFSIVTRVKGLNIAWLACTFDLNGFKDTQHQVLNCFRQRDEVLAEIRRLSASPEIAAVILTPHWGQEGSTNPERRQRQLAKDAIEAGATAIVGTHPHVVGPWEKITTADGKEGLVVYSTGNFISNQRKPEQRIGELALIELTREPGAPKLRITAAGYITTFVDITTVHRVGEASRDQVSKVLPSGNRVFTTDLPSLPRTCDAGATATPSWGTPAKVTAAMLPFPAGALSATTLSVGEYREPPRSLLPPTKLVDLVMPSLAAPAPAKDGTASATPMPPLGAIPASSKIGKARKKQKQADAGSPVLRPALSFIGPR